MLRNKRSTKRLSLQLETLKRLQLDDVHGGSVITKPAASCFILCTATCDCHTHEDCTAPTAAC